MDLLQDDLLTDETELTIEQEAKGYLFETAKWAKFIAISFFIITALVVLLVFVFGSDLSGRWSLLGGGSDSAYFAGIVIGMLLVAGVVGVTYYFLLDFGTQIRRGLETEDIHTVNRGLKSLKTHFIIIGILSMLGVLGGLINLFNN